MALPSGTPEASSTWPRRLRALAFILGASFILLGPIPHQVFGTRTFGFPRWRMYGGKNTEECAGHFAQVNNGQLERLEWLTLLGFGPKRPARSRHRRVKSVADAERIGKRLCKKLGDDADVRVHLRCPSLKRGFTYPERGRRNLCAPQADKAKPSAPKGSKGAAAATDGKTPHRPRGGQFKVRGAAPSGKQLAPRADAKRSR